MKCLQFWEVCRVKPSLSMVHADATDQIKQNHYDTVCIALSCLRGQFLRLYTRFYSSRKGASGKNLVPEGDSIYFLSKKVL